MSDLPSTVAPAPAAPAPAAADPVKKEIELRVAAMDEAQLRQRRAQLQALGLAKAHAGGLTRDELTEICAIYQRMRSTKGGPPKQETVTARASKKINIMDLPA